MKVYELRNILDELDGDSNVIVGLKTECGNLFAYEIKDVLPESRFEEKYDTVVPVTLWLGDAR